MSASAPRGLQNLLPSSLHLGASVLGVLRTAQEFELFLAGGIRGRVPTPPCLQRLHHLTREGARLARVENG